MVGFGGLSVGQGGRTRWQNLRRDRGFAGVCAGLVAEVAIYEGGEHRVSPVAAGLCSSAYASPGVSVSLHPFGPA